MPPPLTLYLVQRLGAAQWSDESISYAAEKAIKEIALSPSSIIFYEPYNIKRRDDGGVLVKGKGEFQNAYGGLEMKNFTVLFSKDGTPNAHIGI